MQNSTIALSRVINFPSAANVTGVRPLVFIQATARINNFGVDIIVASARCVLGDRMRGWVRGHLMRYASVLPPPLPSPPFFKNSACAAYAANAAAPKCSALTYALPDATYFYLGTATSLGMAASSCGA
jgi:hypothetical protein